MASRFLQLSFLLVALALLNAAVAARGHDYARDEADYYEHTEGLDTYEPAQDFDQLDAYLGERRVLKGRLLRQCQAKCGSDECCKKFCTEGHAGCQGAKEESKKAYEDCKRKLIQQAGTTDAEYRNFIKICEKEARKGKPTATTTSKAKSPKAKSPKRSDSQQSLLRRGSSESLQRSGSLSSLADAGPEVPAADLFGLPQRQLPKLLKQCTDSCKSAPAADEACCEKYCTNGRTNCGKQHDKKKDLAGYQQCKVDIADDVFNKNPAYVNYLKGCKGGKLGKLLGLETTRSTPKRSKSPKAAAPKKGGYSQVADVYDDELAG